MAKSGIIKGTVEGAKTVGGAALAAAAVAATGVIVTSVAGAIRKSGKRLESATPEIQKLTAETISKPLLPKPQKRAASSSKRKTIKRKLAAKKRSKKTARKKR